MRGQGFSFDLDVILAKVIQDVPIISLKTFRVVPINIKHHLLAPMTHEVDQSKRINTDEKAPCGKAVPDAVGGTIRYPRRLDSRHPIIFNKILTEIRSSIRFSKNVVTARALEHFLEDCPDSSRDGQFPYSVLCLEGRTFDFSDNRLLYGNLAGQYVTTPQPRDFGVNHTRQHHEFDHRLVPGIYGAEDQLPFIELKNLPDLWWRCGEAALDIAERIGEIPVVLIQCIIEKSSENGDDIGRSQSDRFCS